MNKKMAVPRSQAVGPNSTRTNTRHEQETDVLLIGGGIMSATLGTWLQELEPDWSITMVEQMSSVAEESSNGWNNAGTGHAALMDRQRHQYRQSGRHQRSLPYLASVLGASGDARRPEQTKIFH